MVAFKHNLVPIMSNPNPNQPLRVHTQTQTMPTLVFYGELLWDMLPIGKVVGGAPMNAACHFRNFGGTAFLVSRVGADGLGKELRDRLLAKGLADTHLQTDKHYPTSTVKVHLDAEGKATYDIVKPVAWDHIQWSPALAAAVAGADLLVFGSLGFRSVVSRQTLQRLWPAAQTKVFDLNLRPPHYAPAHIEEALHAADWLKMNDEELALLADWHQLTDLSEADQVDTLAHQFGLHGLLLTKGSEGAACWVHGDYFTHPGYPAEVVDTVGSGDAFLAGFFAQYLCHGVHDGRSVADCLAFACAVGAEVASHAGGTPEVTEAMVRGRMG